MDAKYSAGDLVQVKATGDVVTISSVSPGFKQILYNVFQDGKRNRYRESELVPFVDQETEIVSKLAEGSFANADAFQKYAYFRLFSESRENNLYSYQGNKIIFNPFQYKPLLKFLAVDSDERLLIADEVGVGKTIEAGIILDELVSRGDIGGNDLVLIVCPSVLCEKWRSELKTKFLMDDFYVHNGKSLSYMLEELIETGRPVYPRSIVSEQLIRHDRYRNLFECCLEELDEPFVQLLIVDECHHYRNPGTLTHKTGYTLSLCSERVLMLSATPFNLKSDDLYNQLHMLNPMQFQDSHEFAVLLQQIRNVNQAISLLGRDTPAARQTLCDQICSLEPVVQQNPLLSEDFRELSNKVKAGEVLETTEKVRLHRILDMMNPLSSSFTRTLKRDAIKHRVTRETMTVEVQLTEREKEIYDSFLAVNLVRYKLFGVSERAFGLILNGLERIAASSLAALKRNVNYYANISNEEFAYLLSEDGDISTEDIRKLKSAFQEGYKELDEKLASLGNFDSKYSIFKRLVSDVRAASGENNRIIVFSFYTETLKYLRRRLKEDGYRVALMYGNTPDDTPSSRRLDEDGFAIIGRQQIMRDFEDGAFDILLVSEVGGEGLDFQFCSALINYDLPYNPMRIEQRIGRIDRMGQNADKIIIGSLCLTDTIDMVINRVLLDRISDAADLVGELEPIIAADLAKLNELIITHELSAEEIAKREQEIATRIEMERQTREEFDEARYELVNDKGFREEFENSIKNSRITPHESLLFTSAFLKRERGCGCHIETDTSGTIRVTKDICDRLRAYLKKHGIGKEGDEIRSLLAAGGEISLDFDGDKAYASKDRVFFKPSGVWIHFIIDYMRALAIDGSENIFYAKVKRATIPGITPGLYWTLIYEMQFKGLVETKTYEYFLVQQDGNNVIRLDESQQKDLFLNVANAKVPSGLSMESYDDALFVVEEALEERKEAITKEVASSNILRITSRIQANRKLLETNVRKLENEMIGADDRTIERIKNAISRERIKMEERIRILEKKMDYVVTYSLDSVCLFTFA